MWAPIVTQNCSWQCLEPVSENSSGWSASMPVLDFQADDALRVAEQSLPLPGAQSSKSEWDKLQTSIASLQALGVLKEKPPEKRQRRASLPAVNTFQTASSGLEGDEEAGTASTQLGAALPPTPSRSLKMPDASKFVKFFEHTNGADASPQRRTNGRRWTVVANQVPTLAAPPPPPKNNSMRGDKERNRNSVTLDSLPQRVTTAPGRQRHSVSDFDITVSNNLGSKQDDSDSDAESKMDEKSQTWAGWYKISASQAAEVEVETKEEEKSFDISRFATTTSPDDVAQATQIWEKIKNEKSEKDIESEKFMQGLPAGIPKFAAILMNRFGSLEIAFNHFDYNHKGKVTRGQWQTTLATIRLDTEEMVGMHNKKLFRQISLVASGKASLEITLDQWMVFFEAELKDTAAEFLLTEDRGSQAPKRWQQMKKLPMKALKTLLQSGALAGVPEEHEVEGQATRFPREISAESALVDSDDSDEWEEFWSINRKVKISALQGGSFGRARSGDDSFVPDDLADEERVRRLERQWKAAFVAAGSPGSKDSGTWNRTVSGGTSALPPARSASSAGASDNAAADGAAAANAAAEAQRDSAESSGDSSSEDELTKAFKTSTLVHGGRALGGGHSGVDGRKVDREKVMRAFKQKDDKAVAELNDDELQALAEQVQLQQEIEELDLSHIDAFAYVLLAKLGSFKRAFKWFDFNCTRKITNVTWDTGILLLHVDTESLTGLKPGQIFYRMDTVLDRDKPDGLITRKKWKAFFAGFQPPPELLKLMEEGKTLRERARAKKKQYNRRGSLFRGDRGGRLKVKGDEDGLDWDDDETAEQERTQRLAEEKDGFRAWLEAEMASIADGTFKEYSDAIFRGGAESLLTPYERRRMMMEVAEAHGLHTLAPKGTGRAPGRHRLSLERAPGISENDVNPPPGCVKIYNLKKFSQDITSKLDAIEAGGRLVLNEPFSTIETAVVTILCLDRNLVVQAERWGRGERLVIHDTGSFAKGLSAKLDSLGEGSSVSMSANLTTIEMKLVHAQAAKLGLRVRTYRDENGEEMLKVCNLSDWASEVRERLTNVKEDFVFKNLDEEERAVVHEVARQVGLDSSESEGDAGKRNVMVSNGPRTSEARSNGGGLGISGGLELPKAGSFRPDASGSLGQNPEADASPGRSVSGFGDLRLETSMSLSHSRGGSSASDGDNDEGRTADGAKQEDSLDQGGSSPTSSSALISQAFDVYATGNHSGQRVFLRFVDLKGFAGDLRNAMPKKRRPQAHEFSAVLEICFDDTAQLQSNLGVRVGSGLTMQFFQVFIQKAMNRLGLQIASVLFEVLAQHDE
eukprot:s2079_g7.t2